MTEKKSNQKLISSFDSSSTEFSEVLCNYQLVCNLLISAKASSLKLIRLDH